MSKRIPLLDGFDGPPIGYFDVDGTTGVAVITDEAAQKRIADLGKAATGSVSIGYKIADDGTSEPLEATAIDLLEPVDGEQRP